ncbi:metallophosphoesterase [Oscillibacter valericigenes]|uniref:metallophosphoesterase n=1 Tax=Oscillibacter valericigenes TaxID=351091 RepID=UPI001F19BC8F|nr:metallophosphoesterase [Oscillibacter valericigenes]MCF2664254.1 metallophosphoesterase [Oscillibacter valericigenes]
MALYAIGDLHLSLSVNKSMEVFGPAWENYHARIEEALEVLTEDDTLILAGDTSWGMNLAEAEADFRFLDRFPGKKYLLKGNHDYWWTTAAKFRRFCEEKDLRSLDLLHNNCAFYGDYALCGTRGWFLEEEQKPHNAKVLAREIGRLETSLQAAGEKPILCFLHYPPIYQGYQCPEILTVLAKYHVEQCCYGHLHGPTIRRRLEGKRGETEFSLISADYLGFVPKKICE